MLSQSVELTIFVCWRVTEFQGFLNVRCRLHFDLQGFLER
jgi:hypothetical protein